MRTLIDGGVEVNVRDGDHRAITPLHLAVEENHVDMVQILIDAGAYVNITDDRGGDAPLHKGVKRNGPNDPEIVQILIDAGANVNVKDAFGDAPLHIAVEENHINMVQILVDAGADVNVRDKWGDTPLLIAVEHNYKEILEILLAAGAKV